MSDYYQKKGQIQLENPQLLRFEISRSFSIRLTYFDTINQKRCQRRRCYLYYRCSWFLRSFRRIYRYLQKTFHKRSSFYSCYFERFILFCDSFHSFTTLSFFSLLMDRTPCRGSQLASVEATLGLVILMFMIRSRRDLFLILFSLLSYLSDPQELKLFSSTDFLALSPFFSSLQAGFTFSFIILSYLVSRPQSEVKEEFLCLAVEDCASDASDFLLLLQKEKSFLRERLDEEERECRFYFQLDFKCGCTQY